MSTVKRPEWGAEATGRIFKLGIPKTKFAKLLNVNYSQMCNVLAGRMVNPKMQTQIFAKLDELENKGRGVSVR